MPHFVVERLCLLQAAVTCLSGAEATEQLLQSCGAHLQQGKPQLPALTHSRIGVWNRKAKILRVQGFNAACPAVTIVTFLTCCSCHAPSYWLH